MSWYYDAMMTTQPFFAQPKQSPYGLCVAPMMAWTDRHCRVLHRLAAPSARLYTEMACTDALLRGASRGLRFSSAEHPAAMQLGGNDPHDLATAARMAEAAGFDEVNLNVGCPSSRVKKGGIGACLMRQPRRVAACVAAMYDAVAVPVTVKCRLGVRERASDAEDEAADYGLLRDFVGLVAHAGASAVIVHARKAVLEGLTPAQNRSVPPLRPDWVQRLKRDHPQLTLVVNGGIHDAQTARDYLIWADGVMIGRAAYRNPQWLAQLNAVLFGDRALTADEMLTAYLPYVEQELRQGTALHHMSRHLQTLFNGRTGARRFRRHLAMHDRHPKAGVETLLTAAAFVADWPAGRVAA